MNNISPTAISHASQQLSFDKRRPSPKFDSTLKKPDDRPRDAPHTQQMQIEENDGDAGTQPLNIKRVSPQPKEPKDKFPATASTGSPK